MKQKTKIKIPKNCESFTLEFTFDEEIETIDDFKGVVEGKYYVVFIETNYKFIFKALETTNKRDGFLKIANCKALSYHPAINDKINVTDLDYYDNHSRTYREATPEEIQEFKDKELESKFSKDAWYYLEYTYAKTTISWLFKLDKIHNGNFYYKELKSINGGAGGSMFTHENVKNITKATQQQIDLFLKPKLEFKENEVWKAKYKDNAETEFIFVVNKVIDGCVDVKLYTTENVMFTCGHFNIQLCVFEKSNQIELQKALYSKNRIWNFATDKLNRCRKTNETYFYLSTCGNIERRVDMADVTSHSHFNNKNYFYSYEEIKKYKEALKRFNTQWHENN